MKTISKSRRIILSLSFLAFFLPGCAALNLPANYQVSDTARRVSLHGDFSLGEVRYIPAEEGRVKVNEIENTSFGLGLGYNLEKPIADIVKNAMVQELTAVGARPAADSGRVISIVINGASGKERGLGYGGVRVYLDMSLYVKDRSGRLLYSGNRGQLVKDPGPISTWNDDFMILIKEYIGMYLVDSSFQKALAQ